MMFRLGLVTVIQQLSTKCINVQCLRLSSTTAQKLPKIYTKTGDKGSTEPVNGRNADEYLVQMYIDFTNVTSTLKIIVYYRLAAEFCRDSDLPFVDRLEEIQCALQDVGSALATPQSSAREVHLQKTQFNSACIMDLEKWIDEYTENLPPLKNFILPSGGKSAASLHLARSICRRAERSVTTLVRTEEVSQEPQKYLNRLSDFLFTVARYAAMLEGRDEKIYHRPHSKAE